MKNTNNNIIERMKDIINSSKANSAWSKGVKTYALELLENLGEYSANGDINEPITINNIKELLLNGASDWSQYSYGGCSLVYDGDICERLATPSEQKRTRNGELNPNGQENWLDCQARALVQAYAKIRTALKVVSD